MSEEQSRAGKKGGASPPLSFEEQVRQALSRVDDPAWLGQHSPLAAPYFLGEPPDAAGVDPSPAGRGRRLAALLFDCAAALWGGPLPTESEPLLEAVEEERARQGKGDRYTFLLLELHYFRTLTEVPRLRHIWEDVLFIGKSQYYRDLESAIGRLATRLLERLHPTFRLERPRLRAPFVGRGPTVDRAIAQLLDGQVVAVSGPAGSGKSTLGAAIVSRWPSEARFWYTIHPELNDRLDGLLFALGAFLHRLGSSGLWRQLVASGGRIDDIDLALGLARHDLEVTVEQRPLLCFDEVDRLRPVDRSEEPPAYTRLLNFVSALRGDAPLLLIGQRPVLEADAYHALDALDRSAVAALIEAAGREVKGAELDLLSNYTGGNPRLLVLALALWGADEPLGRLLDRLPEIPVLDTLVDSLLRRASGEERQLLAALSVFRTAAPRDAWPELAPAVAAQVERGLIQEDEQGGIFLLPALRSSVMRALPAEQRERRHQQAAAIRSARGEVTAAAYHAVRAGAPEAAIALWFPQRQQEIQRGQSRAALALFEEISLNRVERGAARKLALLRAELERQMGEPDRALAALRAVPWPDEELISVDAALLWGALVESQGRPEEALARYDGALSMTAQWLRRRVALHVRRAIVHVRQKALPEAWQEASRARYEAEHLQGLVLEGMGEYEAARRHYTLAIELAAEANHASGLARTLTQLSGIEQRAGEVAAATDHLEQALHHYEQVGDRFTTACVRTHLAMARFDQGDMAGAIEQGQQALRFFRRIQAPYWVAVAASGLADTYFELEQHDEAEAAAMEVVAQEEPQSHPYALYTLAGVRRARGRPQEAGRLYRDVIQMGIQNEDRYIEAYGWRALGELLVSQQEPAAAGDAFDHAERHFRALQLENEVQQTVERREASGLPPAQGSL